MTYNALRVTRDLYTTVQVGTTVSIRLRRMKRKPEEPVSATMVSGLILIVIGSDQRQSRCFFICHF